MADGEIEIVALGIGTPTLPLYIADNVIASDAVETIFERLRFLPYTFDDADREDTRQYNHFKHDFDLEDDVDPLIMMLANKARELLHGQGIDAGPIYRIYANLNLFGDFQFAHEDGDGWTALLFANAEWREDWGGEFFAYGSEQRSFDYSIMPKPGRMLIFDGLIRHRGGVPSKFCHEARITLAIKFGRRGSPA